MTERSAANLSPVATFVIEREPGKGYRVTSAKGSRGADEDKRALALLNDIGQPDPNGPSEYFCWFGPVSPSGLYVSVSVTLTPSGEARYHQAWFQLATQNARLRTLSLLAALITGAIIGTFCERVIRPARETPSIGKLEEKKKLESRVEVSPPDPHLAQLESDLSSSREVREKLTAYFDQKGLAADMSAAVIDERRSIKLIADLDTAPPPQETIRLSNLDVAKLLTLLTDLKNFGGQENHSASD